MRTIKRAAAIFTAAMALPLASQAQCNILSRGFTSLPEGVVSPENVSAVGKYGEFLLIGADEAQELEVVKGHPEKGRNLIQVLSPDGSGDWGLHHEIELFTGEETDDGGVEMDIEAIAVDGDTVYVVGSHSAKRSKIKPDKKYEENLEKLRTQGVSAEPNRGRVYRLRLNGQAELREKSHISLTDELEDNEMLKLFKGLPSKEYGVDIEGAAIFDGKLWLGFRGPVLRENYVPVMVLDKRELDATGMRYVVLGGRGIRGMAEVSDGILLIGGPVGDGTASYELYHWDGNDMVPGRERGGEPLGRLKPLGTITPPPGGKAEGITVLAEHPDTYELLIAYDGVADSGQVLERITVNNSGN